MKDDRFTNLEKDIIRTVGRILSSQEMTELKNSIFYAADRIEQATQKAAQKMQDLNEDLKKDTAKRSYPNYQPYRQTNYNTSTRNDQQSKQPHSTYSYSKNYPCAYQNLKIKGQLFPIFLLIIGILGILTGITVTVAGSIASLIINGAFAIGALIVGSTATVASIFSTLKARKTLAQFKRFKKYLKVLGPQPMYTAKEIAEQCSLQEEQVSADLPKLVSAVSFPYAKLDDQNTCLILDKETYRQYLNLKERHAKLQQEEAERQARIAADPDAAAIEEMKQNGLEYIRKIRLINDALPEEKISNQLDRLENICRKIFDYVEMHPKKLPQIRKLMSYYLPMTMKLMERYEQLESHQFHISFIEESKLEIHSALDKIILAFETLFERLLEDERMDLSADISVLETMLAQEGLTNQSGTMNVK